MLDGVIPVACVLGGPDRRTLYVCVADDWRHDALGDRRTARIDAVDGAHPGRRAPVMLGSAKKLAPAQRSEPEETR